MIAVSQLYSLTAYMALLSKLHESAPSSRRIMLWVVGALLLLQLLAVLSTWQCSGLNHRANQDKAPITSFLLWLSGHSMCDGETASSHFPFEGVLGHSHSVRRQRPYAYAFCLTSIHHLCTALVNVVRLRKLHSFQEADIVAVVPKAWVPIIDASMHASNMHDMRIWAVDTARTSMHDNSPEVVKKMAAQRQQLHIFQGMALSDYNLVGMLAKMIALGVTLRPADIFEHKPGDSQHHDQKEATSKIVLFEMTEYKQVLYLDADGLVLQNLDPLFGLNMTPLALLPVQSSDSQGLQYDTRVMLLQPSKAVHAQLSFVMEKDANRNDIQILTQYFSDSIQGLPASLALQSFELRAPNEHRINSTASTLLDNALYVHLFDSPDLPRHWQWANPSCVPKLLPTCRETCDERMSWLHVYSMLTAEREAVCTAGH